MSSNNLFKQYGKVFIFAIFFASGLCGLVYEVIWVRMLGLILGNSIYAVSLVVAAFMAGMGLGSITAGKYSENKPNPLRIYAFLELGIGIFAILSPVLLSLLSPIYAWIGRNLTSEPLFLNIFRFILAFVLLLIPTILMGATFPVLSKYLIRRQSHMGSDIALLYGVNTLGAMTGCLLTGFVLIELLGIQATIFVAALINLMIAATVFSLSRKATIDIPSPNQLDTPKPKSKMTTGERHYSNRVIIIVLVAFAISGLAAISYEVIWTRALSFFVGHTTYAFTSMLGTLLFGIGLGSLLIARRSDKIKNLIATLAVVEILIGLSGIIGVPVIAKVFYGMEHALGKRTWSTPIWAKFIYSFIIMLIPTLLMGMTFPLVSKIYVNMKKLGTHLGTVYALNTAGGIVGSFLASFLLIPALGVHKGIIAIAIVNIIIGAVLLVVTPEIKSNRKILLLLSSILLLTGSIIATPFGERTYSVTNRVNWGESTYYKEGLTNTIEILERSDGSRDLFIDGELNASTSKMGTLVHRMLAEVPLLLHHDPRSIFLVGLGSGMTAGAALPFDQVTNIGCAEISTDIIEAANNFSAWNNNILQSSRFKMQIEDGRIVLLTDPQKYDVMVTGIIHPKYNPGNAGLYSKDYYQLCKSRLNDDGIMCQWIPLNALRESEFKMIIKTFQDVFPHTSLWFEELFGGGGDYNAVLIGSRNILQIDYDLLAHRFADPKIANDMRAIGITSPDDFLNRFMLGETQLAAYAGIQPIITDNRPRLEFGIVDIKDFPKILGDLGKQKESVIPYLSDMPERPDSMAAIRQNLKTLGEMAQLCIAGDSRRQQANLTGALSAYRDAAKIAPNDEAVAAELSDLERRTKPASTNDNRQLSQRPGSPANSEDMIRQFEQKIRTDSMRDDYHFGLASLYQKASRIDEAITQFQKALELNPTYLEAQNNLGIAYMQKGEYQKAEDLFQNVLKVRPDYVQAVANLGLIYVRTGRTDDAIKTLKKALYLDPNNENIKKILAQIQK